MVKADAYGLGAGRVAARLLAAGCEDFFVARLAEGLALRRCLPQARIFVLEGPERGEVGDIVAAALVPALNTPGEVELWSEAGRRIDRPLPAALHLDTGMCRLGLSRVQAAGLDADRLRAIDVVLVMSHLACAEETANPMNALQATRFAEMGRGRPAAPRSFANSSGIFLGPAYHFDLLRPGAALYGINRRRAGQPDAAGRAHQGPGAPGAPP